MMPGPGSAAAGAVPVASLSGPPPARRQSSVRLAARRRRQARARRRPGRGPRGLQLELLLPRPRRLPRALATGSLSSGPCTVTPGPGLAVTGYGRKTAAVAAAAAPCKGGDSAVPVARQGS